MKKLTFILALLAVFMLQGCFWGRPGIGHREHHDEGHHDQEHHDGGDHH